MNFEELLLSSLSRADEEPGDEIIDRVASDSVNDGYSRIATMVDTQIKRIKFFYDDVDGYKLPVDCHSIRAIQDGDVSLSSNDYYVEGNTLYITNKDYIDKGKEYTIRYVFYPDLLVEKTDKPITDKQYDILITIFSAYHILIYKKRYQMADMLKTEFQEASGVGIDEL